MQTFIHLKNVLLRIYDDNNGANSVTSASSMCGIKVCYVRTHTLQVPTTSVHSLPGQLPVITLISDGLASPLRDKVQDWRHYATALEAPTAAEAGPETALLDDRYTGAPTVHSNHRSPVHQVTATYHANQATMCR